MKSKYATLFVSAIIFLSGCGGGTSASKVEDVINEYAATKGLPGSRCQLIAKGPLEDGWDYWRHLVEAGYMERVGDGVKVSELGRSKFRNYSEDWYQFCLLDAKVIKVTFDDKEPVKMPNGNEIFRVGVEVKLSLSEVGKAVAPIAAKDEGTSVEEIVKAYQGGDKDVYSQWIRMERTPEGELSVFDAKF
jgi:hypothetical protein